MRIDRLYVCKLFKILGFKWIINNSFSIWFYFFFFSSLLTCTLGIWNHTRKSTRFLLSRSSNIIQIRRRSRISFSSRTWMYCYPFYSFITDWNFVETDLQEHWCRDTLVLLQRMCDRMYISASIDGNCENSIRRTQAPFSRRLPTRQCFDLQAVWICEEFYVYKSKVQ